MTNILKLSAVSLFLASGLGAATINMDTNTTKGMKIVDPDDASRLADGSLVRWGTMVGGVSALNFVQFATTTIVSVGTTSPTNAIFGFLRTPITFGVVQPTLANQQVYMWVYDTATALATSDQGLFTSTGWVIPSAFSNDTTATYNLALGNTASIPGVVITTLSIANVSAASVVTGDVALTAAPNSVGYIYTLGNAVPEPSAALLGAVGVLGLLRRRRI